MEKRKNTKRVRKMALKLGLERIVFRSQCSSLSTYLTIVANLERSRRCAASTAETMAPSSADRSHISSVTKNFRARLKKAAGPLDALTAMTWRGWFKGSSSSIPVSVVVGVSCCPPEEAALAADGFCSSGRGEPGDGIPLEVVSLATGISRCCLWRGVLGGGTASACCCPDADDDDAFSSGCSNDEICPLALSVDISKGNTNLNYNDTVGDGTTK